MMAELVRDLYVLPALRTRPMGGTGFGQPKNDRSSDGMGQWHKYCPEGPWLPRPGLGDIFQPVLVLPVET